VRFFSFSRRAMRAERCSEGVAICEREVQLVGLWRKRKVEKRATRALHTKERGTFAVAISVNF
jgi:hypothetical protein